MNDFDRAELARQVFDAVEAATASFELDHIGSALAYTLGAILKGTKVSIIGTGLADPFMGHLYGILLDNFPPNIFTDLYGHFEFDLSNGEDEDG